MASPDNPAAAFRAKAAFMKSWKPDSSPSNRDRLELYALHKQASSGDAPPSIPSTAAVADKAKYQAWQRKKGLSTEQAMLAYITECDRQVRTYGSIEPQTPPATPSETTTTTTTTTPPRGIAAIPLLCAAAAESRVAYTRRMANTSTGWWSRQEPLCATPGTILALPEVIVLGLASTVEYLTLTRVVWPALLWPTHNVCLALWMVVILLYTIIGAGWTFTSTILWGSRRTGMSLTGVWADEIKPTSLAIHSLCEEHQPLTVRLVGLFLLPYTTLVETIGVSGGLPQSVLYTVLVLCVTWWYWWLVVPWLCACMLGTALLSGGCFALIDLAGV